MTAHTLTHKLIESHLVSGKMTPGEEIALQIDQTLTQDATGTVALLELEAMGVDRVRTQRSVQYVDHNLLQVDNKNADDHLFLLTACRRFGIEYSRAGNGVSHPLHQEYVGKPGVTLLGSDSHTPAAGALGMLAIGAGGLDVAAAMAGRPYYVAMPSVWGVYLEGELPPWVSAKDIILEMLRRHGVRGGKGRVLEYYGPGLAQLSAMDRHVIANMGTELGATTTVFPADEEVHRYLRAQAREDDYRELLPDEGAAYDHHDEIDLSTLEPLIAMPSSPGNVVPVREVAGEVLSQAYIGSSANPGYRDIAVVAEIFAGKRAPPHVSLDINPASRQVLHTLVRDSHIASLLESGARLHQAGCNGCIGMGQAPATETFSLRTVPRNFPGRSGTAEDKVCLVSPETAAASALRGVITDPRELAMDYPRVREPDHPVVMPDLFVLPAGPEEPPAEIRRGPNIVPLPPMEPLPQSLELPVALRVGDDISTDEILPAGAEVLPLRSNVPAISRYLFHRVDPLYVERAERLQQHAIVGGTNYGQGSSREHAALAPRYLGLRMVLAKSFARIHEQNLVNFGVLPLTVSDEDWEALQQAERVQAEDLPDQLDHPHTVRLRLQMNGATREVEAHHELSPRQREVIRAGGMINWIGEHPPGAAGQ